MRKKWLMRGQMLCHQDLMRLFKKHGIKSVQLWVNLIRKNLKSHMFSFLRRQALSPELKFLLSGSLAPPKSSKVISMQWI